MVKLHNYRPIILLAGMLFLTCVFSYGQKDEGYYYKLGKKYLFLKDTAQAEKHFDKCMEAAEANKSENPDYYYYPALLFYYGYVKPKQVAKAVELITPLMPEVPETPDEPDSKIEKHFTEFFSKEKIKIDKADYIFLRYFIHFKLGEVETPDAFNRLAYAVKFHDTETSLIPSAEIYQLLNDICAKNYAESEEADMHIRQCHNKLCEMFRKEAAGGKPDMGKIVKQHCSE